MAQCPVRSRAGKLDDDAVQPYGDAPRGEASLRQCVGALGFWDN